MMTPDEFVSALQSIMGDGYKVALHPKRRSEPQFDVFPEPMPVDAKGAGIGVTFTVRTKDLQKATSLLAASYAVTAAKNIEVQMERGEAAPRYRT